MRDSKEETYNGEPTFCTVNAYGECPYCDQCGICHIVDQIADCGDFAMSFEDWDKLLKCGTPDEGEDADEFWWDY